MRRPRARAGFTLVELLVVIAIISVLIGLVVAGVLSLMNKGPEMVTNNDIRQLEIAVQNFKNRFGVFPPSRIRLYGTRAEYDASKPLDVESLAYINQIWKRIGDAGGPFSGAGITWNGVSLPPAGGVILEGDQCLVFFLGGIPGGARAGEGFATDPTNPASTSGDRIRPFFEFKTSRLQDRSGFGFPSYVDGWGLNKPYLYFSSGKSPNGYNSGGAIDHSTLGVSAYYETTAPPTRYLNPNTYQIISAGQDGGFGPGGLWRAASAKTDAPEPAFDNQVNFHGNKLGVP